MYTIYECGCAISRDEFAIPPHWPMLSSCPYHRAPKKHVSEEKDQEPVTGEAA